MAKDYTPIPNEYLYTMEVLSDEEFGRLMRWCLAYYVTGEEDRVELKGNERMFQRTCAMGLDRASLSYEKKCLANRKNGNRGGRPRKKTGDGVEGAEEYEDPDAVPEETEGSCRLPEDTSGTGEGEPDGRSENPIKPKKPTGFFRNPENPIEKNRIEKNRIEKEYNNTPYSPPLGGPEASSYNCSFEKFWENYPKKVGKKNAYKAWQKISPGEELAEKIISAVQEQKTWTQWTKDEGQYIPNPSTWLSQQRWEDEKTEVNRNGYGSNSAVSANARAIEQRWEELTL